MLLSVPQAFDDLRRLQSLLLCTLLQKMHTCMRTRATNQHTGLVHHEGRLTLMRSPLTLRRALLKDDDN